MEESEVCSLPGGLASVRKQFETQETATSHNVTQYHFHHRSVQFPRYTTKELRDHFERTIEEAAPSKQIKISRDINRSKWSSNVAQKAETYEMYEASATEATENTTAAVMDYEDFPPPPTEDSDYLPPPPPDLLQMPSDSPNIPECYYSPEPPEPTYSSKYPVNRAAYFKQRNMYELKRLYKHIHPEVRKNIEKDPDQDYTEWEEILPGEVQRTAWMFETKPMDQLDKGDVRAAAWLFETQTMDNLNKRHVEEDLTKEIMLEIQSVRKIETELENSIASRWLFDTQPLDMTKRDSTPLKLVCSLSMEDSNKGDWGRWLFEIKTLNSLNEWESSNMQKEEIIGADVRKHCLVFETQPMDSLKDDSNAKPQTIEEIIGGNVRSARHFFESSPQLVRKNGPEVGKLKKTTMNEEEKGDVRHQKWRFESQPLEHIREEEKEVIRTVNVEEDLTQDNGTSCRADVRKNCWVFETQPMDSLKDDSNARPTTKEEIIAGNVRSARHYFETMPADELKELAEVGKLKKTVALSEERGDVRHQKWKFESQPLEQIREEKKEVIRTIDLEEIDKVDVLNYKQIFETTDLSRRDESHKILIEGVSSGAVSSNKNLFESTPLYAMQDSSGHFHEVKTVRREEVVKGDVTTYKWMFETRPIDQFDESDREYQIIKGISKQEVESGDVKTAKWLFETQPLDAIKYFSNIEDEEIVGTNKTTDVVRGDVKTCKWLFETKPMDVLYERVELKSENDSEEIHKGDVKTCTWLFETQALDTIHDETEKVLKTCTVNEEDIRGKDVRTACFLFETEKLENLTGEERGSFKQVTEIDIESGDVSRMKYIFENQTSDIMTSTSEETMQKLKTVQSEDIQKGNVVNCKWLFENQSTIHDSQEESMSSRTVSDVQGGNVDKGRFIFETYSLDKIQEASSETETEMIKMQKIVCDEDEKGDVRNYTMMFETQPLYAIQDKEGHYHEVTTVTNEEIMRGDVVGSRWLFETKPLDSIRDTDEVYVIKSVIQEDVQKGDVTSAKWKFETQPLDSIAEEKRVLVKTVDDIQGGDVRMNKHWFESDALSQESVRTVNVSEIQKGDVRTAKWRFETQSIDKIRSMSSENLVETVKKEEVAKGDVKQSVWLFEKNPLDHIKEADEGEDTTITREEIPKADVKTTTWLFETTPFDYFNESSVEKTEIMGKSIKRTLEELYSQKMVNSKGILIEANEIGDVRMAKYQLMNKQAPQIQREEVIRGDLQSIMMNLLNRREREERQIVIDSEEKGDISSTVHQLFNQERGNSVEKEEILRGDIQEAVNNLLKEGGSAKRGILIQEDEKGDIRMTIYSLLNKQESATFEKEDIIRGDIKSALQRLSSQDNPDQTVKIKVDDTEKGNVNFYSTCIESGALDYLKQLHLEDEESPPEKVEKEKILGGDIKNTKLILCSNQTQIERTVEDIVPGDVHSTVKVFMSEPIVSLEGLQKEEIVKGDLKAALNSLSESVNQTVVLEKEEVVKGNIPKALRCLEKAQKQHKEVEKPDIIRGNIKGALRSLEKSSASKVEAVIEDLVPGDVKATLKSLEQAKQAVREVEKEEIVKGDIHTAMQCLQEASSEKRTCQQEIDVQGDVRGTIQLLLEPQLSPRMQRRASLEDDVKGDVKMSIKSLYETQEQTQLEKEEVIKGDVKGTIKSLLATAQRENTKVRLGAKRRVRVKQSPAVKNLKVDAQRNIQKIKTATVDETAKENHSQSSETRSVRTSTQQSTTVVEHKTITQNHGIKTLKTEFRNLNSNPKGMIKLDKTKVKRDVYTPKPQVPEPDLPLPPPPPPVADTDLPPPPTPPPPSVDSDIDHLPPPPPPLTSEQDFLPPPPSQQELDSIPSQEIHPAPAKATKMTVKKVKAPALHPVPKLEPKVQLSKTQQVTSETVTTNKSVIEMSQIESKTSKTVSCEIPPPPESPRPQKKVYISPVKFTPPPSPPPFMRGKMSKFNTPLIKAEEKYRKLREENTPPTTPTPTYIHDSVTAALEMLSTKDTEQSKNSTSDFAEEKAVMAVLNVQSDSLTAESSKHVAIADTTQINATVNDKNVKNLPAPTIMLSAKQQIETSSVASVHQTSSVSTITQQMLTTAQKIVSVSSKQSAQSAVTDKVQTSVRDVKTAESLTTESKKEFKNLKTKGSNKSEDKKKNEKLILSEKIPVQPVKPETVTTEEDLNSSKSKSEDKKKKDNTAPEVPDHHHNQPAEKEKVATDKKENDSFVSQGQEKASDPPVNAENVAASEKAGKSTQKVKKGNEQEMQVEKKETKKANETKKTVISQDLKADVKEDVQVKVITEEKEELKKVKKGGPSPAAAPTEPPVAPTAASITDKQPATPAPAKKKKKSKRSKNGAQSNHSKDTPTESKTDLAETKKAMSEKVLQTQETNTVVQMQNNIKQEHIHIQQEVSITESKVHQNFQQQEAVTAQKQVTVSEKKKEVAVNQQNTEEPKEESGNVPITVTAESEQNTLVKSTTESTEESQRQEVQALISHITDLESVAETTDSTSVRTLLNTVPEWLLTAEEKCELEGSETEEEAPKIEDVLSHVRKLAEAELMFLEGNDTMEKHESEPISEKHVSGGATQRISKISIGSAKVESQTKKKSSSERRKEEWSQGKSTDLRAPSPSLRMRSPSPTFITIESTRRTDSPQRVTPSPTLLHRPATPPTPPPRRCDTPTSRITRITPSPTFDKAENLARLKDTTAKLSRGVTPPPVIFPQQIPEKKSEIVESPASFHRQIKIETQAAEASEISDTTIASENDKIDSLKEVQTADVNPANDQKDPVHMPACLDVDENGLQSKSEPTTESSSSLHKNDLDVAEASDISDLLDLSASEKDKKEFLDEAEINKTDLEKDPNDIPVQSGLEMEESDKELKGKEKDEPTKVDLSESESPKEKLDVTQEPAPFAENEAENVKTDHEKADDLEQEMATFDIQAIKNVFEMHEQSSSLKLEKMNEEEPASSSSETRADSSKRESPQETKGSSRQSTPLPPQRDVAETVPVEPSAHSETKSVTEHFSNVDEFGNQTSGTRTITTVSEHSESVSTQRPPFSYADAVKRKAVRRTNTYDESSTEELLRNFHKTWTESETVFKSLGYTVSEEKTSQIVSHQTETVIAGTEFHSMIKPENNGMDIGWKDFCGSFCMCSMMYPTLISIWDCCSTRTAKGFFISVCNN
uniref:Xin actin binding repeat containing 2 n=1 Tax=Myripristis murdjan TaxID=586833 RepID=A0A668AU15_9TELE